MTENIYSRSQLLLGEENLNKIKNTTVAVFGIGGVGGYTVEALARLGVKKLVIVDSDTINITNINRQLIATQDNIGNSKVQEFKKRIAQINPDIEVDSIQKLFLPENADEFDFYSYDIVVDAVDNITAKVEIIKRARMANKFVISAMGAGNKLDPTKFEVDYIENTTVCPLARVMRNLLKKQNITGVKVVYSKEPPQKIELSVEQIAELEKQNKRQMPGSVSFVPSVAGLIIASEVAREIIK